MILLISEKFKDCRNLWVKIEVRRFFKYLLNEKQFIFSDKMKPDTSSTIHNIDFNKFEMLGGMLKKINNFDMTTFDGRLIFQKTVYFLQAFKIYMGYNFSLYIRGPYSPDLTKDGFELKDRIGQIKDEIKFSDEETKKNFDVFLSFIEKFKDKPDDLETLASLHLFHRLFPNDSKDMIIQRVLHYKLYLQKGTCEEGWKFLEKFGLV